MPETSTTAAPATDVPTTMAATPTTAAGPPVAADTPAGLAAQIAEVERAIRDPATADAAMARVGNTQQLAYRRLSAREEWQAEVLALVPPDVGPIADANLRAATDLTRQAAADAAAHGGGTPEPPDWRIVAPPPPAELLAEYRSAEAATGAPWEYLATIHFVVTRMGRIRGNSVAGAQGPMQFIPTTWDIAAAERRLKCDGPDADMGVMRSGGNGMIEPASECDPVGADLSPRRRLRLRVRTFVILAAATALLMPLVWHDVVPSVVSLAVTSQDPGPPVEIPTSTVVEEPTTTTTPLQVIAGPAQTTTTAKTAASPTTTAPKPVSSSSALPVPPLPVTPPPVSVPPPSPSVTLFPLPTPASQPMGIVSGPDGNLWFTEGNRDVVGRISPQGAITEFPTPTKGSQPSAITVGPDRNLWFTEMSGNKVARITPSGAVTEYAIPTAYSYPMGGITTGPDGALWFTEWNAGKVARVDLAGQVTEFAAGTDTPGQIVAGRDGNLWFTGSGGSLWRISPSGTTGRVGVGDLTGVWALTVDRAGNLWYAGSNSDTGRVGRRDPSGRVTEFTIPGRDLSFNGIVEGPDGAIWLTQGSRNTILRLAQDGTLTTYSAPSPMSIAAGPDGNIWFTSGTNGNAIGKIGIA